MEEIDFLDITSLGRSYHYAANIEHKFKQKKRDFGSANRKKRGKANAVQLITMPKIQRRTQGIGVNSITSPIIAQQSVGPNSHLWPNWRHPNQMHVLILSQNQNREMEKGSRSLMQTPVPLLPLLGSEKGMKLLCIFSFFYYWHTPFYLGKVIYYKNYDRIGKVYVYCKNMTKDFFLLIKQ